MQMIKENEWYTNEKIMFRQWQKQEVQYWETVDYECDVIPMGIELETALVLWQHDMYRYLFEKAAGYHHLYTYCLESENKKNYCVEVGFGEFKLFVNIMIYEKKFVPHFHFRREGSFEYVALEKYVTLEKSDKALFNQHLPVFLTFYEDFKDFVLTKSKDRLVLLTSDFSLDERVVEKTKQWIGKMED